MLCKNGNRSDGRSIHPVEGAQNSTEINDLARFAVNEQKKKENTLLEFKKVVKCKGAGGLDHVLHNVGSCEGGKNKVYEAKVWVKPWMNFKEVEEFKLVGDT
ncbi:UNVERIFIED_CONTAM: Cysteine proteinase inhibitor 6 [Sesamum radiatum]|uniref:Cysteine proteinase inhibitor n=1 Tax=Sesamum radiatum TaxID=300843 RepID=A0AAW2W799_SESRA